MKINTDGVLLGALASCAAPGRILDIGSGTGVIAMMMAQRFPAAIIDAIEKDEWAAQLSDRNFKNSVFSKRMHAYCTVFQEFSPQGAYDLIVSNPPFFLNALRSPNERKSIARHTDESFYEELIEKAFNWLNEGGELQLVLPPNISAHIQRYANESGGFCLAKTIYLKSFEDSEPFRHIISLRKNGTAECTEEIAFTIYQQKGVYSVAYKELLKPFFVNF
ncbi:tRNA1(Val) (adenine(37)-N6)-methyltransferase [Olivibacter sp. XZL3]|uniref:tRNA1(Val) (adenine(37)-N6)-methyltransferase n=1 Tax=Olivibacter sp. XZL3 TaxID=1735116 RepID=UPI001416FC88|nr:methyltransferase [Olivibacter sp. XZL3]